MKVSKIEIQNFKAFWRTQVFDIENKNILVFGTNGSGKSSLYYSLHAFVQSSIKTDAERQKYFVFDGDESLLNIHAPEAFPSYVRVSTELGHIYEFAPTLSQPFHRSSTHDVIKLANESSDFMNYRFMLAFSSFRNSQKADIFQIVRNEFFPFWTNEAGVNYQTWYDSLLNGIKEHKDQYTSSTTFAKRRFWSGPFKTYKDQLEKFNEELETKFLSYVETINDLMRDHFLKDDNIKLFHDPQSFKRLAVSNTTWELKEPELILRITKNEKTIPKPHVFLNEARLTGIALSMRMAIFDQRYKGEGDFKILVLDDLLLSLDMGKRMEVINYVLTSDKFTNYQLFIFTHDKGFYNVLRNNMIRNENEWKCFEFYENHNPTDYKNPIVIDSLDSLKKAEKLLQGEPNANPPIAPKYDECALYLRKKAEELIRTFYDPSLENLSRFEILNKLANSLGGFEKEFNARIRSLFTSMLDDDELLTAEIINRLSSDPYINRALPREEIIKTNGLKFKVFRLVSEFQRYRTEIKAHRTSLGKKCKEVDELRDRILNHGAHPTAEPLFGGELAAGVKTIEQLQQEVADCLEWFKGFERDILMRGQQGY